MVDSNSRITHIVRLFAVATTALVAGRTMEHRFAPAHHVELAVPENDVGMPLRVVVYFPEGTAQVGRPAAILCQPLNNLPAFTRSLALELVNNGFVVLTFDWRGHTPEENRQLLKSDLRGIGHKDVLAAIKYLRSLDAVDGSQIVLAGHSVGASFVLEAALADPAVAALAMLGMEAEIEQDRPKNVLWAVGLYDEFWSVSAMRRTMAASADSDGAEGVIVRDFARGTARKLAISGTADHFIELQNPSLHQEIVAWFLRATGHEAKETVGWIERSRALYFVGWTLLLAAALIVMRRALHGAKKLWRLIPIGAVLLILFSVRFATAHFR